MEESNEIVQVEQQVETLESEVKKFANGLSFWAKYLAEKILSGIPILDNDIDIAYSYLLEELSLKTISTRPPININYHESSLGNYKLDLQFTKLGKVEGVNALSENQTIEFSPNVTIIYGSNGSGKSGYVRLMKKVFYSKSPEEIIHNIYLENGHKAISADFVFESAGTSIPLKYPDNSTQAEFKQFAIFDGKSVLQHLDHRNEFEFRPAGLSFFAEFTEAIKHVEVKLNAAIALKSTENNFVDLFDGESEIKTLIQNLSAQTNINDLKKHIPFSEQDKVDKKKIEKQYDDLLLASKGKEKEIKSLERLKQLLNTNKKNVENLNQYFTNDYLIKIQNRISDCVSKEATAKKEGIENFTTDKIQNIGTDEWKNFIEAAEQFAKQQEKENAVYPESGDNCLLCQQPLSADARKLITNYWIFIKSVAEQNAKNAQLELDNVKTAFQKLNFDLFPVENSLTVWLSEKFPQELSSLSQDIAKQKALAVSIISDLEAKTANKRTEIQIGIAVHNTIDCAIDASAKLLGENEQSEEVERLSKAKTKLAHKEKIDLHFANIETYLINLQWIYKTYSINWSTLKQTITNTEKRLSGKYFNQTYIDTFNQECKDLQGEFGISIDPKSSGAKSNRQLLIKGNYPSTILSEGEQKVIAVADFLSEMQLSEVNRGIIFDDPVNSLDEERKSIIAKRLVKEGAKKQVIIFTHDLVFLYSLFNYCNDMKAKVKCHWVERINGEPGVIALNNSPSLETDYKKSGEAHNCYDEARNLQGKDRERKIKYGFTALRTNYEALTIFKIFNGVVERFDERVSIDRLSNLVLDKAIIDEVIDSHALCCRYMEGHLHSNKYAAKKPTLENLDEEIKRLDALNSKIDAIKKLQLKSN